MIRLLSRPPLFPYTTLFRSFDFRYGPGTIVALLHDAILTVGAFAITYKEFSLTTLAAILTIIGFSMNDTIIRSEEHTSELQSRLHLVCRLLLEKKKHDH